MSTRTLSTRKERVRGKIKRITSLPRLSVFRSNKLIYAQIIDDAKGKTLVSAGERELKKGKEKITKTDNARLVGELLAKKAKVKKVSKVVFDRGEYKYHGRIKALAEGARAGGLQF